MSDYTSWDINDYLPGQPLTSAKAISYHENLNAFAEGAPGAPRMAAKSAVGAASGSSNITRGGFGGYGGCWIWGNFKNNGSVTRNMYIALGDSGGFATNTTLFSAASQDKGQFTAFIDFSTRLLRVVYGGDSPSGSSPTLNDPGGDITQIRISTDADVLASAIFWANGGEASS